MISFNCAVKFTFFLLLSLVIDAKKPTKQSNLRLTDQPDIIDLSITYFTPGQLIAQPSKIQYLQLHECWACTANQRYTKLSIIAPDNVGLNTTQGYPVIELSTCKDSFNASCVFATNYIWDSRNPMVYDEIIWPFNSTSPELNAVYMRYKSYKTIVAFSIQIIHTNDAVIQENFYDPTVFNSVIPVNPQFEEFSQLIKTSTPITVANNDIQGIFFEFCDMSINNYNIEITVISDYSTPKAAFDLAACSVVQVSYIEDCTIENNYAISNQLDSPVVSVTMDGSQKDLSAGIYLNVYGLGGELSLNNTFVLSVTATLD